MNNTSHYILSYVSGNHQKLVSSVKAVGLERPKSGGHYCFGDVIRVCGWVIPLNKNDSIKFVIENSENGFETYALTVVRLDVEPVFDQCDGQPAASGFDFTLTVGNFSKVNISINNALIPIWDVMPASGEFPCQLYTASSAFRELHNQNSLHETTNFAELSSSVKKLTAEDFRVVGTEDFLLKFNEGLFSVEDARLAIGGLRNPEWSIDFVKNGARCGGNFSIPGFYSGSEVVCRFSVLLGDFNFLFFSNGQECLYLVQYCTNACLIFPSKMIVVGLTDIASWVGAAAAKLPDLAQYVSEYASTLASDVKGSFSGVIMAQARPYHYIYDYLFGLNMLSNFSDLRFDVCGAHGFDFIDVGFMENCQSYSSLASDAINRNCLSSGGFWVAPCVQYIHSGFDRGLSQIGVKLAKASNLSCGNKFPEITNSKFGVIVWIGVSIEKRSWLEQVDGYTQILGKLIEEFGDVCVLVDGRTFPLSPQQSDYNQKSHEDLLFHEISTRLPNVKAVNMIGLQAAEKVFLAQKIDFFITNYSTDSMYPSAISGKPGVVYVAPSIRSQRSLHVHKNIIEVPGEKVKEVYSAAGQKKAWYETSISMDWRDVYECVTQLLQREGLM